MNAGSIFVKNEKIIDCRSIVPHLSFTRTHWIKVQG